MLKLIDINESNWPDIVKLSAGDGPDSAVGVLAQGYVYRACHPRIIGIADDDTVIGTALVMDSDGEPVCCDLRQWMIGGQYREDGRGAAALRLILSGLEKERKYECVRACVRKTDTATLSVYEEAGFADTGRGDDEATDAWHLTYRFPQTPPEFKDALISDFFNPLFKAAFQTYFAEFGTVVKDWDGLFRELNEEGDNRAFVRTAGDGSVAGFILFRPTKFTSWFFEETCGFIREFWVAEEHRNAGHGAALLRQTESYFREHGIYTSILTTDTAERFYLKHGYVRAPGCAAKNKDDVFIKHLGQ